MPPRPRVRPLTPAEAKSSLANRFVPVADNLRQLATRFGIRPYRTYIVHLQWSGVELGEGTASEVSRVELLPTPKVVDLTGVSLSIYGAGVLPMGSIRLEEISGSYTQDQLLGHSYPRPHEDNVSRNVEFFYEVVEDGRGDPQPQRARFRPLSIPFRWAGGVQWKIVLERVGQDLGRNALPATGKGTEA